MKALVEFGTKLLTRNPLPIQISNLIKNVTLRGSGFILLAYHLIQDLFISQSDRTDLQAQIGTDSQEYNIIGDDLH